MRKISFAIILAGFLVFGCGSKQVVRENSQPNSVPPVAATANKTHDTAPETKVSRETIGSRNAAMNSAQLLKDLQAEMADIHFDYDKYVIKSKDKTMLSQISDELSKNGGVRVVIEGNCDERGTTEYNLALGDRRATAAKEYLIALGVQPARMQTVSNGKEKPLCTQRNEACWARNRRDHFVVEEK